MHAAHANKSKHMAPSMFKFSHQLTRQFLFCPLGGQFFFNCTNVIFYVALGGLLQQKHI